MATKNPTKKTPIIFNSILVFVNGELYRQIVYKTKRETRQNYSHFMKNGITDYMTGKKIKNATFELL